jgi:phytoene dehydrogenase-like protein
MDERGVVGGGEGAGGGAGGVPATNEASRPPPTVHVAGPFAEVVAAERDINRGRMPERPFVLVGQQYLADPTRSAGDVHPIWAYAHTPQGYPGDAAELVMDQIERFAPGLRERIVGRFTRAATEFPAYNSNYVGGDIIAGANSARQILFRPRLALDPYATGIPGVYICSAATPPGAGAHGMNGYNAAQAALSYLR